MTSVLSIDPGVRCTGWAFFEKDRLVRCGLVTNTKPGNYTDIDVLHHAVICVESLRFWASQSTYVVIESPWIRPRSPVRPEDVRRVSCMALAIGTSLKAAPGFWQLELVKPEAWKGNVPKKIFLNRIMSKLDKEEIALIPSKPATLRHNAIDAVGIGFWKTGRL